MSGEIELKEVRDEDDSFAVRLDPLQANNSTKHIDTIAEREGLRNFHLPSRAIYRKRSVVGQRSYY